MARTYHDAPITAAQMDKVLASMNSVSKASNNGKILCVDDFGFLTAKTQQELHIGAVLEPVTITENGTTTPPAGVDGFNSVTVNVSGGGSPTLQSKTATPSASQQTVTPDNGYDGLSAVTVEGVVAPNLIAANIKKDIVVKVGTSTDDDSVMTVTGSYEGSGGSVVAFAKVAYPSGSTCTATDGTTTMSAPDTSGSWIVDIPNAGTWTFTATNGSNSKSISIPISYADSYELTLTYHVGNGYTEVEYLEIGSTRGPYIDTGLNFTSQRYFELKFKCTASNYGSTIFGAFASGKATQISSEGSLYYQIGGTSISKSFDTNDHVYKAEPTAMILDDVSIGSPNWSNVPSLPVILFAKSTSASGVDSKSHSVRIYYCKIYDGANLVRELYPCYRDSDNEPGFYDAVNAVFYANIGTGSFVLGPEV